ncbi:MAG TPA: hypothetical protein VFC44_25425 [Candidatus Saccharimonadales bacterium]|nr:hypothetical protein [Candidatus Saccharimonadales bacterium]
MRFQNEGGLGIKSVKVAFSLCSFLVLHIICGATTTRADSPPIIIGQPANHLGAFFGSAMFSVTTSNTTPMSYQWEFNGEPLPNATNSALLLAPLTYAQAGYYNVVVSNSAGSVSSAKARLTVSEAIVSASPSSFSNVQNFLLQFTNLTSVSANSATVYALQSNGVAVPFDPYENEFVPAGLTNIISIALGDYANNLALHRDGTVVAWNYNNPAGTNVPSGLSNVTAIAVGYGTYNFALRSDGTVAGWSNPSGPFAVLWSNVVAIAAGLNTVLALKADGTVFESANGFSISQLNPVPGLSNVIAIATESTSLALKADGTVVGWDGLATNPLPGVSNAVALAVSTLHFLVLKADGTVAGDSSSVSQFPVALSNVFAIDFNPFEFGIALFGDGSPFFTVQPAGQTLTNGGSIWLHARAVGAQPMSYQWQLDGINLPGATNADLTITNAQGKDTGQYRALVSNSVGAASSLSVSVTIPISSSLGQALNATNLIWSTSATVPWFVENAVTHDGISAAQSGATTNNMSTQLKTTVAGPGTLTFWWKVSSEQNFDFLSFYIDSTNSLATRISGEVDWQQQTFSIGAGFHPLTWIYAKDPDVSVGQDAGWVDQVSFTPTLPAKLGIPTFLPGGHLLFQAFTANGNPMPLANSAALILEASSNLVDWVPLTNNLILTNGSVEVGDPNSTNLPARFYRLMRP